MSSDYASLFLHTASEHLTRLAQNQQANLQAAAALITQSIADGGMWLTFGSGHSELVAREPFWRAGGLAATFHLADHTGGDFERVEGLGKLIIGHYDIQAGDCLTVVSHSGVNPVPIEIALHAKARGARLVTMSALAHSQSVKSRHSSGQKLYELADVALDTLGVRGDALLPLPDSELKVGALSTLVGIALMQALIAQVAVNLQAQDLQPPVIVSANVPEGDAHNAALKTRYLPRMIRYPLDTADLWQG
jgi:uncharacterized phosphosugar-binding protein